MLLSGGDQGDASVAAGRDHQMLHPCRLMPFESICRETLKSLTYFGGKRETRGLDVVLLSSEG